MQDRLGEIEAAGVQVVGMSYDSVEVLKTFADKQKIAFLLLSDAESKTIAAYALKNQEMVGKQFGEIKLDGVPYSGTILVGKEGVVRAKLFLEGYRKRHTVADLVNAAKRLSQMP